MSSEKERRRYPRTAVDWLVVLLTKHGFTVGEAMNVSDSGALIRSPAPLAAKEKSRIFMVPPNRLAFGANFKVAWVKAIHSSRKIPNYLIGIQFNRLLDGDRQFVKTLIGTQRTSYPDRLSLRASL
jgi:PilZ domain